MSTDPKRPRSSSGYDHQMGGHHPHAPQRTRDMDNPRVKQYSAPSTPNERWHFGKRLQESINGLSSDTDSTGYAPDTMTRRQFWLSLLITSVLAAIGSTAAWFVLRSLTLPAYTTSNVLRGISTGCAAIIVALLVVTLLWWLNDQYHKHQRPKWRCFLIRYYAYLAPAVLVVISLGIPLAATNLYLGGISVDQEFRTQYLTRLTDSVALSDMNYLDLPSYYPAAWFWIGGRFANLLGLAGWEAFQPWAIVSLSVCASLLTPLWQRLVGSLPIASALAVVNTYIVLNVNAEEPYAAVVLLGTPLAVILAGRGLAGSKASLVAVTVYLGISAATYTLYTGIVALIVVVLAYIQARRGETAWNWEPIRRLFFIGIGSLLLAAISWAPYYFAKLTGGYASYSAATRYLPESGTEVTLPMFSLNFFGLLCLLGLCYLFLRRKATDMQCLGVALLLTYAWIVLSMLATLLGHSLLGFRLNGMAALFLATAGIFLLGDLRLITLNRVPVIATQPRQAWTTTAIFMTIFALGAFQYIQQVPVHHQTNIDLAYSDTDPTGNRGTAYPADSGQFYAEIDTYLREAGFDPAETVVLTSEFEFLAYFPYRGFQALTAHYANPLGEFPDRNDAIEQWAEASWDLDADEFLDLLDEAAWKSPDVFIFKADSLALTENTAGDDAADDSAANSDSTDTAWSMDISEDLFPNNPNVRWRALSFNAEIFQESSDWTITQIGPFAVVSRQG
ncbi:MAG: arabinofuranosyltransferase [Corynebacterium sp.]|nr:arabinofuranosyltransferase [Corynebacterium sp.]